MIRIPDLSRVDRPDASMRLFVEINLQGVGVTLFNGMDWPFAAMCFGTGSEDYDAVSFKRWLSGHGFDMGTKVMEELVKRFLEVRTDWIRTQTPSLDFPDWLGARTDRTLPHPSLLVPDEIVAQVALAS